MSKRILIAYASVSGSTGEIAQTIGQVLTQTGLSVQVLPVEAITTVEGFDAVILGSSIRAGRWLPEAMLFLEEHQIALSHLPVAYFTACLTMVNDTEASRRTVLAYMEPVLQLAPLVKPVAVGLFAGSLDPKRQLVIPVAGAPQGDYRDWEAIRNWAQEIRPALLEGSPSTGSSVVLRGAVLRYAAMSGADLGRADLRGSDLFEANLSGADLHGANLSESNLRGTKLQKVDLDNANLEKAGLDGAHLNEANLRNVNLSSASMMGTFLSRANLEQANLSQAILNGANLHHANLRGANLSQADLNWADFSYANLDGASLSETSLGWTNFSHVDLSQTNLQNARYNSGTKWPEGFSPEAAGCILAES